MAETDQNSEFIDVKPQGKTGRKRPIKDILDGSLLTRDAVLIQLPYILFLVALAIVYIANRFHAEKVIRETAKTQVELRDLRAESISISSELMHISKQSEVIKLIKEKDLGLVESTRPPVIIKVKD